MKILITGITGSGGSYLGEHLVSKGNIKVIGTSRSHNPVEHENISLIKNDVKLITVDLEDFSSLFRILDEEKPDIIFHIASMANVKDSFENPIPVVKNNVNITLNLLETIRILKNKNGYNPIIKICSTSELYGNASKENIPISENCPLQPINPYAVSKLTQDSLAYVYYLNYGLNVIRTRMFSYFNARRGNLFATNFAKQIINIKNKKQTVLNHGNLDSIRTLLSTEDAAEAYWLAATKGKVGEVYNIGANEPVSVGEILNKLIKKSGVKILTSQNYNLIRPSDISNQIPNCEKFKKQTGWSQKRSLEESLNSFWKECLKLYNN